MFAVSAIHTNRSTAALIASRQKERKEQERLAMIEQRARREAAEREAQRIEAERLEREQQQREALDKMAEIVSKYRIVPLDGIPRLTVKEIVNIAIKGTPYSYEDIIGHRQIREMANYRHYAILCAWALRPDQSLPQLGKAIGGRDHTTILHAKDRFGFANRQEAAAFIQRCGREAIMARLPKHIRSDQ